MEYLEFALPGIVPPAVVAAMLLSWSLAGGRRDGHAVASPMRVVALGAGYIAGHVALFGLPPWPAKEAWEAIPYVVLAAFLVGLLEWVKNTPQPVRLLPRLLLAFLAARVLLDPLVAFEWPPSAIVPRLFGMALAWVVLWTGTDALAARRPGVSLPLVLTTAATGTSITLLFAGSARFGQLGGALATACGMGIPLAWWRPQLSLGKGGVAAPIAAQAALILNGAFYLTLPVASPAWLAGAPLLAWLGEWRPIRRLPAWQSALACCLPTALAVAGAAYLAWRASRGEGEYPY